METPNRQKFFSSFAFYLLIYTLLVILWGAWVRISHSGDGCGDTWPLCHGKLIPEAERGKTWVEYSHRLMSGIYGFVVIYFWWISRKLFPKGHFTRKVALLTLIFTITEALLGAKLVLFKLVASNDTPYRAFIMALHQINSFLLTGVIALSHISSQKFSEVSNQMKTSWLKTYGSSLLIVAIGITGAWASLANTLFPTDNLWQGLLDDFNQDSHFLIRLRVLHPIFATLGAGGLCLFFYLKSQTAELEVYRKKSIHLAAVLGIGIAFGYATLFLHAPVWMKIVHLTLAHTIWILLLQWLYQFKKTT